MRISIKVSVITPFFNGDDAIRQAIESVGRQGFAFTEHIVIDSRPSINGHDPLDGYSHLIVYRAKHVDLADALRIGLRLASGDIVVWLNPDERFADGAFSAVLPFFEEGARAVMGNVRVDAGDADGVWINSAPGDFAHFLRHWEPNAVCMSPAALFVRRSILIPFPPDFMDDRWIDLDVQLLLSSHGLIEKTETVLAEISYAPDHPARRARAVPAFWQKDRFPFLEKYIRKLPGNEQADYLWRQRYGYQTRRQLAILESTHNGTLNDLTATGEVIPLSPWCDIFCAADDTVAAFCGADAAHPLRQTLCRMTGTLRIHLPVLTFGPELADHDPAFLSDIEGRAHQLFKTDPVLTLFQRTFKTLRWHFFIPWDDRLAEADRLAFQRVCGLLTGSPDQPFFLKPSEPFTILEGVAARLCLYRQESPGHIAELILKQFLGISIWQEEPKKQLSRRGREF
ncbi:MAG: glycosyltransferase [Kiritimatiellae bacterium]|nr:glycosyltransferase [Kiritimatiellia bacterium]